MQTCSLTQPSASPKGAAAPRLEITGLQGLGSAAAPLFQIDHWQMAAGVHWVYGPSGSGKTTLLRLLAAPQTHAATPTSSASGACTLPAPTHLRWHSDTNSEAGRSLSADDIFYVDPNAPEWDAMTLPAVHAQLLPRTGAACKLSSQSLLRSKIALIEGFGLAPHQNKAMYMLSSGTRRKVFLMAALLAPQPLILLDEPSAALDASSRRALQYALAVRNRLAGQVIIVATALEPHGQHAAWRGSWQLTNTIAPQTSGQA